MNEYTGFSAETYSLIEEIGKVGKMELVDEDKKVVLSNVVIDLKLPNRTDDIAAIYVPLSRVKRLTDLIILRHFDYKILLMKPSESQLTEKKD